MMRVLLILALGLVALDIAWAAPDERSAALLQASVSNETQGWPFDCVSLPHGVMHCHSVFATY